MHDMVEQVVPTMVYTFLFIMVFILLHNWWYFHNFKDKKLMAVVWLICFMWGIQNFIPKEHFLNIILVFSILSLINK